MELVTTLPRARPLTVADLESMPDDGHRYELIDGTLIVSPAPVYRHQVISLSLARLLLDACPPDLRVLTAPFDVVLASDTSVQPDLLVARRSDFTAKNLPGPPLLAVEILSPSTALIDLNLKKARYLAAGVHSYWVVAPDGPRLRAWTLEGGDYREAGDVEGEAAWTATMPYPVTVVPARLLDRGRPGDCSRAGPQLSSTRARAPAPSRQMAQAVSSGTSAEGRSGDVAERPRRMLITRTVAAVTKASRLRVIVSHPPGPEAQCVKATPPAAIEIAVRCQASAVRSTFAVGGASGISGSA